MPPGRPKGSDAEAKRRQFSRQLKIAMLKLKGYAPKQIAHELNCSLDDITKAKKSMPLFMGLFKPKPRD